MGHYTQDDEIIVLVLKEVPMRESKNGNRRLSGRNINKISRISEAKKKKNHLSKLRSQESSEDISKHGQ